MCAVSTKVDLHFHGGKDQSHVFLQLVRFIIKVGEQERNFDYTGKDVIKELAFINAATEIDGQDAFNALRNTLPLSAERTIVERANSIKHSATHSVRKS